MDGTEVVQDNTSEQTTETSALAEQVANAERKGKSDGLAEVGRYKKQAQDAIDSLKKTNDRIRRIEDEADDADRAANKDNPGALNAIDERRKRRDAEDRLDGLESELKGLREGKEESDRTIKAGNRKTLAEEIAAQKGVDPVLLTKLSGITDGSKESIMSEADTLPKVTEPRSPMSVDSGKGSGIVAFTSDQLSKMSPQEYSKNKVAIDEAIRNRQIR